jgi:hypothetical protein
MSNSFLGSCLLRTSRHREFVELKRCCTSFDTHNTVLDRVVHNTHHKNFLRENPLTTVLPGETGSRSGCPAVGVECTGGLMQEDTMDA